MLSENLQALADRLGQYSETGVKMEAIAVFRICAIIETAAADAKALEAMTLPLANQRTDDLPKNVVRIKIKSRQIGATYGKPGGGDAA